jgi:hypothetical protein
MSGVQPYASPDRTGVLDKHPADFRISRFPCMELADMPWFSDSAGPMTPLAITRRPVLPSPSLYKVGNPKKEISELNSPACTPPVNASPPPCGKPTHDSGSRLVASLYHVEDFHLPIHAGFYRRFQSEILFLAMLKLCNLSSDELELVASLSCKTAQPDSKWLSRLRLTSSKSELTPIKPFIHKNTLPKGNP